MTVRIAPKADIPKSADNETCCADKDTTSFDHTDSLLADYSEANADKSVECKGSMDKVGGVSPQKEIIRVLNFDEAPEYLKHNIYILSGYRGVLSTRMCIESIFWWTNETINIWTHIFGFLLFLGLTIYDLTLLKLHASFVDQFFVGMLLVCFQICMANSALYHTFSCRSEHDFNTFLCFDLLGIAMSLLAIYTSGIYYAYWCIPDLLAFYLVTVTVIFLIAIAIQHPKFNINYKVKIMIFLFWAAYGVVPTLHWTYIMGGYANPIVKLLLPRVLGMYAISGTAFLIYTTKIPERFRAGKFDYLGHSHQWWHLFIVAALYYWHNTGMMYVEYRMNHACPAMLRMH